MAADVVRTANKARTRKLYAANRNLPVALLDGGEAWLYDCRIEFRSYGPGVIRWVPGDVLEMSVDTFTVLVTGTKDGADGVKDLVAEGRSRMKATVREVERDLVEDHVATKRVSRHDRVSQVRVGSSDLLVKMAKVVDPTPGQKANFARAYADLRAKHAMLASELRAAEAELAVTQAMLGKVLGG